MVKCDKKKSNAVLGKSCLGCALSSGCGEPPGEAYSLNLLFQISGGLSFVFLREKLFEGHV